MAVQLAGSTLALTAQTSGAAVDRRALGPRRWRTDLEAMKRAGFTAIDLVDGWLPIPEFAASELEELGGMLADLGLSGVGLNVSRHSLIHPTRAERYLEYTLAGIDAVAALSLPILEIGFHPNISAEKSPVIWFWEHPETPDDRSDETWALATERIRTVCDHAAAKGVEISIELYEDSLVSTSDDVARIITEVDRPNLGVNPDLGNTYRSATPQREHWLHTLRGAIPHLDLWHVKNYHRWSGGPDGPFAVVPATLDAGDIDYRLAFREVLASGYTGAIVMEHYSGDALWIEKQALAYAEYLLAELAAEGVIS